MQKAYIVSCTNKLVGDNNKIVYISLDKENAQNHFNYLLELAQDNPFLFYYVDIYELE